MQFNNEERKLVIDNLLYALQKYRSNSAEMLSGDVAAVAKMVQPITLGDDFLPVLIRLSEMEEISRHDFYNIMTLASIHPEMQIAYDFYFPENKLPEPHIGMITGDDHADDAGA